MHGGEGAWPTGGDWFVRHLPNLTMRAFETLDGSHADSCEFADLEVTEALEGHRESHFLELVRDVSTNHGWEGRRTRFFLLRKKPKTPLVVIT
jgi:hypothetical protein